MWMNIFDNREMLFQVFFLGSNKGINPKTHTANITYIFRKFATRFLRFLCKNACKNLKTVMRNHIG